MSSTSAIVSLEMLQRFTLFTSLPPELRFIIWRLTLLPRIVEILASENFAGFYSRARLPTALYICRESRQAVKFLYPSCFGSFLQPERVRFNFDLDVLYIDGSQEEDGLHHFFGILKETELARLKYVAIDEDYFMDEMVDIHSSKVALRKALKAMTGLQEIIVVCEIENRRLNYYTLRRTQIEFYDEHKTSEEGGTWAADEPDVEELPNVHEKYKDWKLSKFLKMTPVYGWRAGWRAL